MSNKELRYTTLSLKDKRDAAFSAYLALKRDRKPARVALLVVIASTRAWHAAEHEAALRREKSA